MCTGCAARHSKAQMPHKLGMTSPKRPPGGGRPLPGLGPGGTFLPVLFEIGGWFRQRCPSRLAVLLEHPAREVERAADEDAGAGGAGGASADDVPAGTVAVRSPTDGVYYARPAPDAAPFVNVGGHVSRGQPIGLVEVMKTFNRIAFDVLDGPDLLRTNSVPVLFR